MALPLALAGQDLIGQARTGTGKTYAFGIAMLQSIGKPRKNRKKPRGLVVVPTRELAVQVSEDLVTAAGKLGSRVLTVYGGRAYEPQVEALKAGVDVIVGTPGRLLDLVKQKHLDLSQVTMLVLDEADRMMDLGFLPDIERIFKLIPAERQTMLFSATMPGEIVALSRKYLNRPTHVRAEMDNGEGETTPQVRQLVWRVHRMDKIEILGRLLQADGRGLTMVFCETKRACDMVAEQLDTRGFAVAAVHGDLGQGQREQALRAFRNGKIDVLVATDVAARGIDIDDVTHVVNYDAPTDDKTYVHRVGRTGRAGKTGISVTFVEWEELTRWKMINNMLGLDFAEPEETYSTSPHVYAELSIPAGTKGVLPRAARSRAGLDAEEIEDLGETGRSRSRGRKDKEREEREPRPARTPRQRRRTRGGRAEDELVSAEPVSAAPVAVEAVATGSVTAEPVSTEPVSTGPVSAEPVSTGPVSTPPVSDEATSRETASDRATSRRTTSRRVVARQDVAAEPAEGTTSTIAPEEEPMRRRSRRTDDTPAIISHEEVEAAAEQPSRRTRTRRGASSEALEGALSSVSDDQTITRSTHRAEAPAEEPSFLASPPPPARREPERIVPPNAFTVIFQSPDLATDDDEIAPSAATERQQQRRRPRTGGGNSGGNSGGHGGGNRRR
ncbi:DEAD/DEAH box helicase [Nonomuraea africana]|uniref:Superfamily II DNA/RNA helicase n=1 Tax=Nonomuraea africana TaxID=46171 RepID=A0ABR9KMM0_9ACTN|nr:DEAD/DEAH box helicase [Nonomuraea africana]MBE1563274.1 superfamily II DNA/RNA helicase [Nonomuraea africana]